MLDELPIEMRLSFGVSMIFPFSKTITSEDHEGDFTPQWMIDADREFDAEWGAAMRPVKIALATLVVVAFGNTALAVTNLAAIIYRDASYFSQPTAPCPPATSAHIRTTLDSNSGPQ